MAIGLVVGLVALKIPLMWLKKGSLVFLILSLITLFAVFFPKIGTKLHGASRWISIGNNAFQPSEFFKIAAILYLAAWLSNTYSSQNKKNWAATARKGYHNFTRIFIPFVIFLALITGIFYLQRDITTLGIISVVLIIIYFQAGTPFWHLLITLAAGAGSALLLVTKEPYRFERIMVFLHPETDPLGMGRQLKQSILALGSGGFFGKGLGMSVQKFNFLPQAMSDSIFAILGEETGIVGCTVLIILFLLFLFLGFKIANSATDMFSKLTAVGITTWIVFQAFINIASTMGLFPLSGVPLPFFSYGGSHIIAELIGVGILLNISKNG